MLAIPPYCYLLSFLYISEGNAMLVTFFTNILMGTILPVTFWILRLIPSTRSFSKICAWFFRLFPTFCFSFSLLNVSSVDLYSMHDAAQYVVSDLQVAGGDLLMMGVVTLVDLLLVFGVEYLHTHSPFHFSPRSKKSTPLPLVQDPDVVQLKKDCAGAPSSQYPVLVRKLSKQYPNGKLAVHDISFHV